MQPPSENRTVQYSNGHFPDTICVQFSNGKISHLVFNHSKTGLIFRPQNIGKANWPFENRTSLSGIQMPSEYRTIWLKDTNQPSEYQTSPAFRWWLYYIFWSTEALKKFIQLHWLPVFDVFCWKKSFFTKPNLLLVSRWSLKFFLFLSSSLTDTKFITISKKNLLLLPEIYHFMPKKFIKLEIYI
jgi:hypothetical protein